MALGVRPVDATSDRDDQQRIGDCGLIYGACGPPTGTNVHPMAMEMLSSYGVTAADPRGWPRLATQFLVLTRLRSQTRRCEIHSN